MDTILTYYIFGLAAVVVIGVVLTLIIFRGVKDILPETSLPISPRRFSTLVKIAAILVVLVGGISHKFYGCEYKYENLIDNPTALNFNVMGQIEGALRYLMVYIIIVFTLCLAAYILKGRDSKKIR